MTDSRLSRSEKALYRSLGDYAAYCRSKGLDFSLNTPEKIFPTEEPRRKLIDDLGITPLPPTDLEESGASTVIVMEEKGLRSNHGTAGSAIAQIVGDAFCPGVNTIHIRHDIDPYYNQKHAPQHADAISHFVTSQGAPALLASVQWHDSELNFDAGDTKTNPLMRQLRNITSFFVEATGNDGAKAADGARSPNQEHNILTHFTPLAVHVGAAAKDDAGTWNIEGYSSANSPTFLAPVAPHTFIQWDENSQPEAATGTSAAAPYAAGALAALNRRYGSYLTREQILYAVIATCDLVYHVNEFGDKTPQPKDITYERNAAGLLYNPEYAGFGLMNVHGADRMLSKMVSLAQERPEGVTTPVEECVEPVSMGANVADADGLYHYKIPMPPGIALKTTIEANFADGQTGDITITSPSGTRIPMIMTQFYTFCGLSTSHAWAGEQLGGDWEITSTKKLDRLRLNQHHFLENDLVRSSELVQAAGNFITRHEQAKSWVSAR